MNRFRKLRAALTIALTWGVVWGIVGTVVWTLALLRGDFPHDSFLAGFLRQVVMYGTGGAVMGVTFAGGVALASRGKRDWSLTLPRACALGAVGGLVLCLMILGTFSVVFHFPFQLPLLPLSIFAALGGIMGIATFGTASRGSLPPSSSDRQLPTSDSRS